MWPLTENYIHVRMPGMRVPPNRLIEIHVCKVQRDATYGAFASEAGFEVQALACSESQL